MSPGSYAVVASIDPNLFRAKYHVSADTLVLGPYAGVLHDSGERLELKRPAAPALDAQGLTVVPFIVVDAVRYNDKAPWSVPADGDGPSLQRLVSSAYGDDPTNWFASGISPGSNNVFNA